MLGAAAEIAAIAALHGNHMEIAASLGVGGLVLCVALLAAGLGLTGRHAAVPTEATFVETDDRLQAAGER